MIGFCNDYTDIESLFEKFQGIHDKHIETVYLICRDLISIKRELDDYHDYFFKHDQIDLNSEKFKRIDANVKIHGYWKCKDELITHRNNLADSLIEYTHKLHEEGGKEYAKISCMLDAIEHGRRWIYTEFLCGKAMDRFGKENAEGYREMAEYILGRKIKAKYD